MLETIRAIQPAFVVGENVAGLTTMENGETFERICASLEDEGYTVESFVLPAASVGAWHRRDRIWIVCYTNGSARRTEAKARVEMEQDPLDRSEWKEDTNRAHPPGQNVTNSNKFNDDLSGLRASKVSLQQSTGVQLHSTTDSNVSRSQRGSHKAQRKQSAYRDDWWSSEPRVGRVANGVPNRTHRIKALGNAVVPQIPYEIFKAIEVLTQSTA